MAEPTMELDGSLTATPTTYDIPFINGNTVDATKDLRFGADAESHQSAIAETVDGSQVERQNLSAGDGGATH